MQHMTRPVTCSNTAVKCKNPITIQQEMRRSARSLICVNYTYYSFFIGKTIYKNTSKVLAVHIHNTHISDFTIKTDATNVTVSYTWDYTNNMQYLLQAGI